MTFALRTGVPKTVASRGRKPTEFPFADMEVGTSFLIPVVKGADFDKGIESWRRKIRTSLKVYFASFDAEGQKFETGVTSEQDENGEVVHGLGVWRTA